MKPGTVWQYRNVGDARYVLVKLEGSVVHYVPLKYPDREPFTAEKDYWGANYTQLPPLEVADEVLTNTGGIF